MIKRQSSQAILGLDILRGFAIILMLITHGYRLYVGQGESDNSLADNFLKFFILIEPFTSALFLFLVGIGINISFHKQTNYKLWLKSNIKKSVILYFIGMFLFFIEYGVQFPDVYLSPSILSAIAFSVVSLSLSLKYKLLPVILSLVFMGLSIATESIPLSGINAGPGGFIPLVLFSFAGYGIYEVFKNKSKYIYLVLLLTLITWFIPGDWTKSYDSSYHVYTSQGYTGIDYIKSLGESHIVKAVSFWNHSLISVFRIIFVLTLSLILFLNLKSLESKVYNKALALMGRHALGCYILHLMVIAFFYGLNLIPTSAVATWGFIGVLVLVCLGYSHYKEKK